MPWPEDLISLLEEKSVGTFNSNIFATSMASIPLLPSGAATCQIQTTGGTAPDNVQNNTIYPAYLQPSAQLTFRADAAQEARDMADLAFAALFVVNRFINSGWYQWIRPLQSEPIDMGQDSRGQARFAFNVIGHYNRRG